MLNIYNSNRSAPGNGMERQSNTKSLEWKTTVEPRSIRKTTEYLRLVINERGELKNKDVSFAYWTS